MIFFLLLLPLVSEAASWRKVWEAPFPGAPRAAFYDAAGDRLLVSWQDGDLAKVSAVSILGKVENDVSGERAGNAGPLRAYSGRIYWAVGADIFSFPTDGGRLKKEASAMSAVRELAIDGKGKILIGAASGVGEPGKEKGGAVDGLFLLVNDLYILRDGKLSVGERKAEKLCAGPCHGLERAPDGQWVRAEGKKILRGKEVLAEGETSPGRFAYVYRRESQYDLLVVPFPEEKIVRAYQRPEEKK